MRYPPQQEGRWFGGDPEGGRGFQANRAAELWGVSQDEYARRADVWPLDPEGELLAIAMIETKAAVDNIEEILEVPGLGAILLAQADLSMSLGVGTPAANPSDPEVMAAVDQVARACAAHRDRGGRVICGRYQTPEGVEAAVAKGFTMFTSRRGDLSRRSARMRRGEPKPVLRLCARLGGEHNELVPNPERMKAMKADSRHLRRRTLGLLFTPALGILLAIPAPVATQDRGSPEGVAMVEWFDRYVPSHWEESREGPDEP